MASRQLLPMAEGSLLARQVRHNIECATMGSPRRPKPPFYLRATGVVSIILCTAFWLFAAWAVAVYFGWA